MKQDLILLRQSEQLDTTAAVMARQQGSVTNADTVTSTPVKEERVRKKTLDIFSTSAKVDRNPGYGKLPRTQAKAKKSPVDYAQILLGLLDREFKEINENTEATV